MITRTLSFLLFALFFNVVFVNAQSSLGVGGGYSIPMGNGSEYWNSGYNLGVDYNFQSSENIHFGAHIAYHAWTPDEEEMNNELRSVLSGTRATMSGGNTIINFYPYIRLISSRKKNQSAQYFGQIGIGYTTMNVDVKTTVTYNGDSQILDQKMEESYLSTNFGVGLDFVLTESTKLSLVSLYHMDIRVGRQYLTLNCNIAFVL